MVSPIESNGGKQRQDLMTRRRQYLRESIPLHRDPQLSLAIDAKDSAAHSSPAVGRTRPRRIRVIDVEPILWMRDVVQMTNMHRSTIHRWIKRKLFPAKDAPKDRPRGWLRSTIQRWELGAASERRERWRHD